MNQQLLYKTALEIAVENSKFSEKRGEKIPLFVPYNIRNQIINENGQGFDSNPDISKIKYSKHFETLLSYMSEKKIFQSFKKRQFDRLFTKSKGKTALNYQDFQMGIKDDLRSIKNNILYSHNSSVLNCGLNLMDLGYVGAVGGDGIPFSDDTGLKAYWKFNEASGKIINQSESGVDMGSTADLTVTGATFGAVGKIGDALDFDGINDECSADDSVVADWNWMHQNGATLTIAFWYAKDFPDSKGGDMICTTFAPTTGLLTRFNANRTVFIVLGTSEIVDTSAVQIPNDTNYHFYVMRYDDATGILGTNFDNGTEDTDAGNNLTNTTDAQRVLGLAFDTNASFYDGRMDEVSMWDIRMSDALLTELFNSGDGLEIY